MNKNTKNIVHAALLITLGIIIPFFFHMTGVSGKIFLPMHIPVFIAGIYLTPFYALIVGITTPIISSLATGMPPIFPMAILMMVELGTYGIITSFLIRKFKLNIFITLITSMICGRILSMLFIYLLVSLDQVKMNPWIFIKTGFVVGIPGLVIQLVLIPIIARVLRKG